MRAYSMDLRERALLDSDARMNAADVAAKYRVSGSWVRLLKQRRRETGEVAPRAQRHGRRPMLEPHLHTLAALIAEQPDHAAAPTWDPTCLVCLDETGVTNNLLRRYGRALRGERVHVMQGQWTDAVAWAEKGHSVVPQHRAVTGMLAGVLAHTGEHARSMELRAKLGSGEAYGAPAGLFYFHAARSEWELAASWFEQAVAQHDTRAPWILPRMFGDRLTSSPYWPALAKKMNLS